jgi:hypothetical protein
VRGLCSDLFLDFRQRTLDLSVVSSNTGIYDFIACVLRSTENALCRFDGGADIFSLLSVEKKHLMAPSTRDSILDSDTRKPDMPDSMNRATAQPFAATNNPEILLKSTAGTPSASRHHKTSLVLQITCPLTHWKVIENSKPIEQSQFCDTEIARLSQGACIQFRNCCYFKLFPSFCSST